MLTIDLSFATLIAALAGAHQLAGQEMRHGCTADIERAITPGGRGRRSRTAAQARG
jgi:hypothetical protein